MIIWLAFPTPSATRAGAFASNSVFDRKTHSKGTTTPRDIGAERARGRRGGRAQALGAHLARGRTQKK